MGRCVGARASASPAAAQADACRRPLITPEEPSDRFADIGGRGIPGGGSAEPGGLVCPINVSEGRDEALLRHLAQAAGPVLLDLHRDPDHHRAVLTLGSLHGDDVEAAARRLAQAAVSAMDLRHHQGAHPRFGVVDVVPFVPLDATGAVARPGDDLGRAVAARDRFATWAATTLGLPCFVYGPERTLPELRRHAFDGLEPDTGPPVPHPSAGACAVGARPALVAYNVWLAGADVAAARRIAGAVRGPAVRALGLDIGGHAQVSCNLVDPFTVGPAAVLAAIADAARQLGVEVARSELVGLAPLAVVAALDPEVRARCDLDLDRTFEARVHRT